METGEVRPRVGQQSRGPQNPVRPQEQRLRAGCVSVQVTVEHSHPEWRDSTVRVPSDRGAQLRRATCSVAAGWHAHARRESQLQLQLCVPISLRVSLLLPTHDSLCCCRA